ncbi:SIS domain-containing protein [Acidobacteriota bacterium]
MCGIVGILSRNGNSESDVHEEIGTISSHLTLVKHVVQTGADIPSNYLEELKTRLAKLQCFQTIFLAGCDVLVIKNLTMLLEKLREIVAAVDQSDCTGYTLKKQEQLNSIKTLCLDALWQIEKDIFEVVNEIQDLSGGSWGRKDLERIHHLWCIDYTLRNIGRIEVRGRDSAGLSVMTTFSAKDIASSFNDCLDARDLRPLFMKRLDHHNFTSYAINGGFIKGFFFSYKVASEIGRMGDNIHKLRKDIKADPLLDCMLSTPGVRLNILSHTRWASNGVISESNAHPHDNRAKEDSSSCGRICAVLNGDIDNYQQLMSEYTARTGKKIPGAITTDAKIIPLTICEFYEENKDFLSAFLKAVNLFEGSFAIAAHHLDEPGKMYLALKGSGQSLYIGLRQDALVVASELYGVVEASPDFIKMNGEWTSDSGAQGQILVLDRSRIGRSDCYAGYSFDGCPLPEGAVFAKRAEITTRDICIGEYSHYFLKEINDSVSSVEKTLRGRYTIPSYIERTDKAEGTFIHLDESAVPSKITEGLTNGRIRRVFCIGQGTASVAAAGVAHAFRRFLDPLNVDVVSSCATELSGYLLDEQMDDSLVIAVSQSGTTCDTNRTVDLARARGACVIAIINRRNSDLVYKADGVLYTSDGRDVEMSVASTKAFYSQVVAGYLLALYLGWKTSALGNETLRRVLEALERLPNALKEVLAKQEEIKRAAGEFAPRRLHWAVAGSGFNHIAAQELRIKLSELCYKSIACDYLEDKKHIDLSSEPLILVCAAGLDTMNLADAVKEVAIFKAHRSIPIVLASEGAERFRPYAAHIIRCPVVGEGLDFIPEVMVGHLFGFYAAQEIDQKANPLRSLRKKLVDALTYDAQKDSALICFEDIGNLLDDAEVAFIQRELLFNGSASASLEAGVSSQLPILLAYLQGKLPPDDLKEHFGIDATPHALIEFGINTLSAAINQLTRPIDAIKHQAKTVTVGISREELRLTGVISRAFADADVSERLIARSNMEFLSALEPLISHVEGYSHYQVTSLNHRGLPLDTSQIERVNASGIAATVRSRTESDNTLKGTKWLCLKERRIFVGKGRSDGRSIVIIPLAPDSNGSENGRGILLLHLEYNEDVSTQSLVRALKRYNNQYDRIVAAATEINGIWSDDYLHDVPIEELFDESRETLASILSSEATLHP